MVTMSTSTLHLLLTLLGIYFGWYVYTVWIFHKAKMDKVTTKKFKKICKWEFRDPIRQEHIIIKEFIEKYTQEHKIDWDEYI